jgi:hypothetical protein
MNKMNFISITRFVCSIFIVLLAFSAQAVKSQSSFYRHYWHPFYHGQRLNYCQLDGKTCGLAVASAYCRMMGYDRADQAMIANNVGETRLLDHGAYCKGWECDGFKTIRCVGKIPDQPVRAYDYRLRRYVEPRFNHYRVDWCYDGQKGCGHQAAFSFCRRMGYTSVRNYRMETQLGATQTLGSQKLCFGNRCKGFGNIDCYR